MPRKSGEALRRQLVSRIQRFYKTDFVLVEADKPIVYENLRAKVGEEFFAAYLNVVQIANKSSNYSIQIVMGLRTTYRADKFIAEAPSVSQEFVTILYRLGIPNFTDVQLNSLSNYADWSEKTARRQHLLNFFNSDAMRARWERKIARKIVATFPVLEALWKESREKSFPHYVTKAHPYDDLVDVGVELARMRLEGFFDTE